VRLGLCVSTPSKIVCVGLNYKSHAAETSARVPEEPVVFLKATSSLCGPNDKIVIPRNSMKTDWEVELAVVIEKHASYI
jgi:2,4-didehydro-3-deoxy-L-rhamnonate hydrolase